MPPKNRTTSTAPPPPPAASAKPAPSSPAPSSIEDEVVCGICFTGMDPLSNPRGVLNTCEHVFCTFCITAWSASSNHCPHCKQRYTRVVSTTLVPVEKEGDESLPKKVVEYMNSKLPKNVSKAKLQAAKNAQQLPNVIFGPGTGGTNGDPALAVTNRFYEIVEEKKIRKKNYRHEDDDDSDDDEDEEGDEANDDWLTSLLDDDPPTTTTTTRTSRSRGGRGTSSTATTATDGATSSSAARTTRGRGRGRAPTPVLDDDEDEDDVQALLLGIQSSVAFEAIGNDDIPPPPSTTSAVAAPPSAGPPPAPRSGGAGTQLAQQRGFGRSNEAVAESIRNTYTSARTRASAAAAAQAAPIIRCAICETHIGRGHTMVSCCDSTCTFLAHTSCVGGGRPVEDEDGEVSVGSMAIDGTYYCPEHPMPDPPAAPATPGSNSSSATTSAIRRRGPVAQEPEEEEGSTSVAAGRRSTNLQRRLRVVPEEEGEGPTELGGGEGFAKLPGLPTGTLGTGDAMSSGTRWTQGTSNGGNVDALNSQRLQGIHELQNRKDLAARSSALRIQTQASQGSHYANTSSGGPRKQQAAIIDRKPVMVAQPVLRGSAAHIAGGPAGTAPPPRVVGKKSGRTQQEQQQQQQQREPKTPVLQTLESLEEQVFRQELSALRQLQIHAKKSQGLDINLRPDTWDPFTGELRIPRAETPAEQRRSLDIIRKEEERLDARLKERAHVAAKAYVRQVEASRVEHQKKTEARELARERAALLKLQMLIATRRREYAERQAKERQEMKRSPSM